MDIFPILGEGKEILSDKYELSENSAEQICEVLARGWIKHNAELWYLCSAYLFGT